MHIVVGYDLRHAFPISEGTKTCKVNEEPKVIKLLNTEATRLFDREKKPRARGERSGRRE